MCECGVGLLTFQAIFGDDVTSASIDQQPYIVEVSASYLIVLYLNLHVIWLDVGGLSENMMDFSY